MEDDPGDVYFYSNFHHAPCSEPYKKNSKNLKTYPPLKGGEEKQGF
jgi:hypothetical protein